MRTHVIHATVVDGTGAPPRPDSSVLIEDYLILDVLDRPTFAYDTSDVILDARGGFVLPGLVNHHAHGLTRGPLMIVGEPPLSDLRVRANLDRQLRDGVTTALNVDGYPTTEDAVAASKSHPITVRVATLHTPAHLRWALEGPFPFGGIAERHRLTAAEMVARGALAVGETGPGMDPHWWDYTLIPTAVERATGLRLRKSQATELREASDADALALLGQGDAFLPTWRGIREQVEAWAALARQACDEAVDAAVALDVPLVFHHTPTTFPLILAAAQRHPGRVIAAHSNLQARSVEDAKDRARQLRDAGALVDVMTGDTFGPGEFYPTPEVLFALFADGLVDLISTDYSGGFWDPMLRIVAEADRAGVLPLGQGVRAVTSRPAEAVPGLAPQRGFVAPGQVADLAITAPGDVATVTAVLTSGVRRPLPQPG